MEIPVSASPSISISISPSVSPSVPPLPLELTEKPILYKNSRKIKKKTLNADESIALRQKTIPSWNTLGRPKNPKIGTSGFNFQTWNLEIWDGKVWWTFPMRKIN